MNVQQARNVTAILQRDPLYYRNFGIWWYHVKAELKRHGIDKSQLPNLGDYTCPVATAYYQGMSGSALDAEAFDHQYVQTFHKYNSNMSATPDGEVYQVQDQDVE